ncbi:MAG: signal peptide peptidase SppA [Rikenellaceae bacterium]
MKFFKTFLACLLAIFVGSIFSTIFSIFVFMGVVGALLWGGDSSVDLTPKPNSILHIDFSSSISDSPSQSLWDSFDINTMSVNTPITTYKAVQAIEAATYDPNIKGLFLDFPMDFSLSTNAIYELRMAIEEFRAVSGKFVISYSDYYTQGQYWLAAQSDVIYMNPYGAFEWSGMASQVLFYKNTLAKFGVEPEIFRHGRYKSAIEPFTLDRMSEDSRNQTQELLGSMWGRVVKDVAQDSGVDSTQLQEYANTLELTQGRDALRSGVVDSLAYRNGAVDYLAAMTQQENGKAVLVSLYDYAQRTPTRNLSLPRVALLYADGEMYDQSMGEDREIIGRDLAQQIEKLRRDDQVKAVVVRVNSPGGSVMAADIIYNQMVELRKVKPVVISMGDYAASGGYYISCMADEIIAAPTTITGSIGVFGMMFNIEKGAHDLLGLSMDVVKTNDMADIGNIFRAMTPAERHFMQSSVDSTYVRFVGLVAQGRGMSYQTADDLAQGRVFSGVQALENGLVDGLGTLNDAIFAAARRANLAEGYLVDTYPKGSNGGFSEIIGAIGVRAKQLLVGSEAQDIAQQEIKRLKSRCGVQAKIPWDLTINM